MVIWVLVLCTYFQRCSTEVFIETLLAPCMKQGTLNKLQNEMIRLDPTLNVWSAYLTASCRYLNKNSLNHVLYHFQLFMKVMDGVLESVTVICLIHTSDTSLILPTESRGSHTPGKYTSMHNDNSCIKPTLSAFSRVCTYTRLTGTISML